MVSDPWAKTMSPAQTVVAVVLQVREGRLQVLLWERALEPYSGAWSLPGGELASGETLEQSIRRHLAAKVDVRELAHLEQLETRERPRPQPPALGARDRLPRARPERRRPGAARRHALAPGRRASRTLAFDHERIVLAGPRPAAREALVHEHRLRARAGELHHLRAARPLPRGARATTSRRRTSSACSCAATCSSARAPAASRAPPAAAPPRSSASARGSSRSPTSSRCCGRLAS